MQVHLASFGNSGGDLSHRDGRPSQTDDERYFEQHGAGHGGTSFGTSRGD